MKIGTKFLFLTGVSLGVIFPSRAQQGFPSCFSTSLSLESLPLHTGSTGGFLWQNGGIFWVQGVFIPSLCPNLPVVSTRGFYTTFPPGNPVLGFCDTLSSGGYGSQSRWAMVGIQKMPAGTYVMWDALVTPACPLLGNGLSSTPEGQISLWRITEIQPAGNPILRVYRMARPGGISRFSVPREIYIRPDSLMILFGGSTRGEPYIYARYELGTPWWLILQKTTTDSFQVRYFQTAFLLQQGVWEITDVLPLNETLDTFWIGGVFLDTANLTPFTPEDSFYFPFLMKIAFQPGTDTPLVLGTWILNLPTQSLWKLFPVPGNPDQLGVILTHRYLDAGIVMQTGWELTAGVLDISGLNSGSISWIWQRTLDSTQAFQLVDTTWTLGFWLKYLIYDVNIQGDSLELLVLGKDTHWRFLRVRISTGQIQEVYRIPLDTTDAMIWVAYPSFLRSASGQDRAVMWAWISQVDTPFLSVHLRIQPLFPDSADSCCVHPVRALEDSTIFPPGSLLPDPIVVQAVQPVIVSIPSDSVSWDTFQTGSWEVLWGCPAPDSFVCRGYIAGGDAPGTGFPETIHFSSSSSTQITFTPQGVCSGENGWTGVIALSTSSPDPISGDLLITGQDGRILQRLPEITLYPQQEHRIPLALPSSLASQHLFLVFRIHQGTSSAISWTALPWLPCR